MTRILLVEREPAEHAFLAQTLRDEGCEVFEVTDQRDLWEVVDALDETPESLDLIIADAEQCGRMSPELLLDLQCLLGRAPLILLTDEVDAQLEDEAATLEARYIFLLPCAVDALRLADLALARARPVGKRDAIDSREVSRDPTH